MPIEFARLLDSAGHYQAYGARLIDYMRFEVDGVAARAARSVAVALRRCMAAELSVHHDLHGSSVIHDY